VSNEHILVVDDEPDIRRLVQEILEDEGYRVRTAEDAARARAAVTAERPDLVLLDIWLPDTDGITLLKEWSGGGRPEMPVVVMSGHGTVETAVEATRLGAYDFVEKPVSLGKLLVTCKRALQAEQLRQENLHLRRGLGTASELVGNSPAMRRLRESVARVAATDAWVLITGEAGSGKAVAARYLHRRSQRADQPFVEISLGAIPASSVTAQLFGTEQDGVVTPGSFEQAEGGTLLLDEIGDLDGATQTKLLNVIEERQFLRVGGKKPVRLDVRIVAATNQDLATAVAEGRFREDLYYRLNVVPLHIPPLREHGEDIPELVQFYLDWLTRHERLPLREVTPRAMAALAAHDWPGNIRELKNLLQRLLILRSDPTIDADEVREALGRRAAAPAPAEGGIVLDRSLREARDAFEKRYLEYHLARTNGNVSQVAEIAGMERTHLYRKLKQLGIAPKQARQK
jgi:DNA-binding NtrC family response regulator